MPNRAARKLRSLAHSKRLRRLIAVGAAVLAVALITHRVWLAWGYTFLDVGEPPQGADAIVMLGGGSARALEAARLYRAGEAPRVIISGCAPSLQADQATALAAGVPASAMQLVDHAESTWNEAQLVLARLRAEGARSALIVTDGFHTRRARATYAHRQDDDQPITLTFVAVPGALSAETWYRDGEGRITILREYVKLGYYLLKYGVTPW